MGRKGGGIRLRDGQEEGVISARINQARATLFELLDDDRVRQ